MGDRLIHDPSALNSALDRPVLTHYEKDSVACRWQTVPGMEAPERRISSLSVSINHTILFAEDKAVSAAFLAQILGRPGPTTWGPFAIVDLGGGTHVEFATVAFPIQPQHYAFLVGEDEFDGIYCRIRERGIDHWADPDGQHPGEFN